MSRPTVPPCATRFHTTRQQASPVFPAGRVCSGDTWAAEWTIPDPAFGAIHVDSDYEVLGSGKKDGRKYVKTAVRNRIELQGRGPLLDQVGALAGVTGEIRVTTEHAEGSGTIRTERKTRSCTPTLAHAAPRMRLSARIRLVGSSRIGFLCDFPPAGISPRRC